MSDVTFFLLFMAAFLVVLAFMAAVADTAERREARKRNHVSRRR